MSACTLVGSITQLLASILKDKSDVLNYMEVFTRLEGIIRTQSRVQHIVMMRTEMKQLFIWIFIARHWYSNPAGDTFSHGAHKCIVIIQKINTATS